MAIVSITYYEDQYMGAAIAADEFARYEKRAEQAIRLVTRGRYQGLYNSLIQMGQTAAAQDLQSAYMDAICAQIEYYLANGIISVTSGQSDEGFTVGKVTVHSGSSQGNARGDLMISPASLMYLEQTGLLGRHLEVSCRPFAPYPWR